jgi:hypothetical protein
MRNFFTLALISAAIGVVTLGCGGKKGGSTTGGGDGGGGSGGEGGGTTTTTTGTTTTTTKTSSLDCSGTFTNPTECQTCAEDMCCQELTDCQADAECNDCFTNPNADPAVCDANALLMAIGSCGGSLCADQCKAASTCNPISNEGCDSAAGQACDLASSGGYQCFDPPNDVALCGTCSNMNGPFCAAGTHCLEDAAGGTCAHYCCDDGDCGTGTCNKDIIMDPNVGVCIDAAMKAACDAPVMSPSNGSCVTL